MFRGHCFPRSIILQAVYFKITVWPELPGCGTTFSDQRSKGRSCNHSKMDIQVCTDRWIFKFAPIIESRFRKRKKAVSTSWRMDETYIKVKGVWKYLYRAVDKQGNTVDFLLTNRTQRMSAQSFLIKAIGNNGMAALINIDKSGANISAIRVYNKRTRSRIKTRICKYLNNIVEQDHRFIKRRNMQGLGFKNLNQPKEPWAG